MLAIVAMLATSCVQDQNLGANASGEIVSVSVNVGLPASRAFSDGASATRLQYAVYTQHEDLTLEHHSKLDYAVSLNNGHANINLDLATGDTYAILFWADKGADSPYTVDFENYIVTVDYTNALCNDESRDAFFATITFTVNGPSTINAELKRPFAQINIGTNDLEKMANIDRKISHSKVSIDTYSKFNLITGNVVGDAQTVDFGYAEIPSLDERYPVNGYNYLAMCYFLTNKEGETCDVKFSYKTENNSYENSRAIGAVPVKLNHRTNLYGALITSNEMGIDYPSPV